MKYWVWAPKDNSNTRVSIQGRDVTKVSPLIKDWKASRAAVGYNKYSEKKSEVKDFSDLGVQTVVLRQEKHISYLLPK